MQLGHFLQTAIQRLSIAGVDMAHYDARTLILHGLNANRSLFISDPERILTPSEIAHLEAMISRREAREPVGTIIGERGFWDLTLKVTKDVLEPRPDSETLIELCLDHVADHQYPMHILDCGTGSGCLLLALLQIFPNARGTGLDISEKALDIAKENANLNHLQDRTDFLQSDWFMHWDAPVDLIISNPPYIPSKDILALSPEVRNFDPLLALDGGEDGLAPYSILGRDARHYLKPNGLMVVEYGIAQTDDLVSIFSNHGWDILEIRKDLGGIDRAMILRMKNT